MAKMEMLLRFGQGWDDGRKEGLWVKNENNAMNRVAKNLVRLAIRLLMKSLIQHLKLSSDTCSLRCARKR